MQRGEAAVRVGVKQAVGALCRLLAAAGLDSVPNPESFRRAKVSGGAELEGQLWQLLSNILQMTGVILCESGSQLKGISERRKLVVAGLWQTGYYADWICGREGGEGGETGTVSSRDLLLALGWLLAAGTLEKMVTLRAKHLDRMLLTSTPVVDPEISADVQFQLDSTSLRKHQWLVGCVRFHGRTLLSMQAERACLLHALVSFSLPSSVSSGPCNQSSTVLQQDCVQIRELCVLLEAYLNWKQVEQDFWLWMDSVVTCHLTEAPIQNPTNACSRTTRCHHGNQGLEKLEDMLSRLPTGAGECNRNIFHSLPGFTDFLGKTDQFLFQRKCPDKGGRGASGGAAEERRERGGGVRLEGELDTSSLSMRLLSQSYRVRLQAEGRVTHSRHTAEPELQEELPASRAIPELAQTEAWLLERRNRKRLANRIQLQELIGRLDQLVLIPP
ncbi:tubulin epsilon and delta complex protein 1 [Thalassophryne amazonica]|uniref:tubulin epsilon and delta complex protein 1 n=1 Tax=Thalassophryne amazonica TaxID=390379 RepID=UPI001471D24E|nr:tubulin epsilon and delta complex protein 1 [Thalassophryne amazonica]